MRRANRRRPFGRVLVGMVALTLLWLPLVGREADAAEAAGSRWCDTAPVYDGSGPQGAVYRLYRAALGREPDRAGYEHWLQAAAQGHPLPAMAADFIAAPEFQETLGTVGPVLGRPPDNEAFVVAIYRNAFSRLPDERGMAYWLDQMNRGLSWAHLLVQLAESAEFRARTAAGVPPGYRPLVLRLEGRGDARRTVCIAGPSLYRTAATNVWELRGSRTEVRSLDGSGAVVGELQVGPPRFEWEGVAGEEGMVRSWASVQTIEIDTAAGEDRSIDTHWSVEIMPVSFARPADPVHTRGQFDSVRHVFVPFDRPVDLWTGGGELRVTAYDGFGRWKGVVFEASSGTADGVLGRAVVPAGTGYLHVDVADGQRWMMAATPTGSSSVRVEDPRGDVVVTAGFGENPAYEPRADLLSYNLSFGSRVEFRLELVEVDPSRTTDVWVGFDTSVSDPMGYPDFAIFPTMEGNGLHALRDGMWRYTCDVERAVEGNTHVVSFDASCVGDATQLQLAGPYQWSRTIGSPPQEWFSPCAQPDPPADCPAWATYADEIPASPPIVRSP